MKNSEFNLIMTLLCLIAEQTSNNEFVHTVFAILAVGYAISSLFYIFKEESK